MRFKPFNRNFKKLGLHAYNSANCSQPNLYLLLHCRTWELTILHYLNIIAIECSLHYNSLFESSGLAPLFCSSKQQSKENISLTFLIIQILFKSHNKYNTNISILYNKYFSLLYPLLPSICVVIITIPPCLQDRRSRYQWSHEAWSDSWAQENPPWSVSNHLYNLSFRIERHYK